MPLPRARVTLVEALLATATNADGQFLFERVPPGTYTLSVTKDGYERQIVTNVVVAPGQIAEVKVDLISEVVDMEELVVKGEDLLGNTEIGLLEVRAESATVQDAISSELIGKAGASDAAGALKLVVGATVSEGKYATVRGLSDRYTGTTLERRAPSVGRPAQARGEHRHLPHRDDREHDRDEDLHAGPPGRLHRAVASTSRPRRSPTTRS